VLAKQKPALPAKTRRLAAALTNGKLQAFAKHFEGLARTSIQKPGTVLSGHLSQNQVPNGKGRHSAGSGEEAIRHVFCKSRLGHEDRTG
jgi:hypothetical protein